MSEYSVTCQSYRFFFPFLLAWIIQFLSTHRTPCSQGRCMQWFHPPIHYSIFLKLGSVKMLTRSLMWQQLNWYVRTLCREQHDYEACVLFICCMLLLPLAPPLFFLQTSAPTCLYALWITHQNRIHIHQWRITVLSVRSSPYRLFCHVGILFSIKALLQYTSMVVYNN